MLSSGSEAPDAQLDSQLHEGSGSITPALDAVSINDDVPAHRSHDPAKNSKRSDPFQFGSRYLKQDDDVFEFNAWDHVETDDAYKEYSERQFEMQRREPVSDFDKLHLNYDDEYSSYLQVFRSHLITPSVTLHGLDGPRLALENLVIANNVYTERFNSNPARWWDLFYRNNSSNFFKNRKWLQQEFPILADVTREDAGSVVVLEIGAGAGNTAFPVLAANKNPLLKIHACDFSKAAVEVMRRNEAYGSEQVQADVWDVAGDCLPPGVEAGTVDVAVMIFVFSALSPKEWPQAVRNVHRLLKPGGLVCFRDYGRGDLAQVRFRKGRYLEENFYVRGDGTRVYFFDKDELAEIWTGNVSGAAGASGTAGFEQENLGIDRRLLVNRAEKIKMYRCWLQGQFRKK